MTQLRKIECDTMQDACKRMRDGIPFKHFCLVAENPPHVISEKTGWPKIYIVECNAPIQQPVQLPLFADLPRDRKRRQIEYIITRKS